MPHFVTREAHFTAEAADIAWSMVTTPPEWTAWMPDLKMILREEEGELQQNERIITYAAVRSRPSEHHWVVENISEEHLFLRQEQEMRLDRLGSRAVNHLVHRWSRCKDANGELFTFLVEWQFTGILSRLFLNRIARSTFTATAQRTIETLATAVIRSMQGYGPQQPPEEE